jgi:hypothetical protein
MTEIERLHSLYNTLTGFQLSMRYDREATWFRFLKDGFTAEDLRFVLVYLKCEIKKGKRYPACLGFRSLIENLDTFEEYRELAKTVMLRTKPPTTDKEKVIQMFRPVVESIPNTPAITKSLGSIIPKLIEELKKAAK